MKQLHSIVKNYHLVFIYTVLLNILLTLSAQARVLHWPKVCEKQMLTVTNLTTQPQTFWLQEWDQQLQNETQKDVDSRKSIDIELQNNLANPFQNQSLLQVNSELQFKKHFEIKARCLTENIYKKSKLTLDTYLPVSEIEDGERTFKEQNKTLNFHLQNLASTANKVELYYFNLNTLKYEPTQFEVTLKPKEVFDWSIQTLNLKTFLKKQNSKILYEFDSHHFKLISEERLSVFYFNNNSLENMESVNPQKSQPDLSYTYFDVGPRTGAGDHFIIKIKDPLLIQKAREQITKPENEKIVFAQIQLGSQKYNRNLAYKEKPLWSWSVTEVTNISDFGSTLCNGEPQAVEDRAKTWTEYPARICFWGYRIKKELKISDF